jgi:hypothetical protein
MYCPKCAAQNLDDAKFCRSCGADISLVPQAIGGQLAQRLSADDETPRARRRRERHSEKPTVERAVRSLFMGLAFIFVAFAVRNWAPGGGLWWFWMFLPAAGMLSDGVGALIRLREEQKRLAPPAYVPAQGAVPAAPYASALPPRRHTGELVEPPPSVTEATTRHLGIPVERERKDV